MRPTIKYAVTIAAVALLLVACTITRDNGYSRYDSPEDPNIHSLTFWPESTNYLCNSTQPSVDLQIGDWTDGQNVWSWIDVHNIDNVHGLITFMCARHQLFNYNDSLWIGWYTGGCGGTCYNAGWVPDPAS